MPRTNLFIRIIFSSLPLIAVSVLALLFVYIAVAQVYRAGANDPQLQIATDAAVALAAGVGTAGVIPQGNTKIESELSTYVIVYDASGRPTAGSGSLHNKAPVLPEGVLEAARVQGHNTLTWSPEAGLRQAIVVVPYSTQSNSGFVMAGRSLAPTQERMADLNYIGIIVLLVSVISIVCTVALREWLIK